VIERRSVERKTNRKKRFFFFFSLSLSLSLFPLSFSLRQGCQEWLGSHGQDDDSRHHGARGRHRRRRCRHTAPARGGKARSHTRQRNATQRAQGHYNFRQIPDFHVGDKRENFYFTYDGPNGREKHEFKTKDALNMIGTATAFVDKLVAQQRQVSEKEAARPDLDYARPEKWTKDEVAIWLASKGLKENFVNEFIANDIDGAALSEVENDDLANMGIKKEENQAKLLKSIRKLFQESRPKTTAL
jgi:hypothetical protein